MNTKQSEKQMPKDSYLGIVKNDVIHGFFFNFTKTTYIDQ